ncbi:MAG: tol-pal system protein YbgF [Hydrogenothermaceae bacterium]|nr:tol-pal system protein YbgF [Hydrogenothermaceae bacterium]
MRKFLIGIVSVTALSSCASEDKIVSLQRELISLREEVNQLKVDNQANKSSIENLNSRIDKLSKVVSENSIEIEKLKVSKSSTFAPPPPPPPSPQQLPRESKEQVSIPSDEKGLYQYALDLYYKGNYEEARKYFVEFLKKYPDSDLYGNAVFWAGQTFYAERKFKDAIEIFNALISKCDEGKIKKCVKYPDAMLKIGFGYIELGDVEKGKEYLNDLVKRYPDSDPAQLAKKKLEVLR